MKTFRLCNEPLDPLALRHELTDPACGGYAAFEGWVRDHNEGQRVTRLEYEAFAPLALQEGDRVLSEAIERFGIEHAACVHRVGDLAIGDMAVWVGASARHRHEAFLACRYIIDEVKHRLPIWKKEHYESGHSGWVNCERCAEPAHAHAEPAHAHEHGRAYAHDHAVAHAHARPLVPDYSRQMALKEVGPAGQARLRAGRILVVGAGGLGVPVLTYLAGAGVGRLGIVDGDRLEPSNLHRQTLYALDDVGQPKAELAAARLRALNPDVDVRVHPVRLDASNGAALIEPYALVIDCTDNFSSKFLLNDLCVRLGKPVIFSSIYQYEGQLQVVRSAPGTACLRCIWPEATRDGLVGNCAEAGVLGPIPGVFGSLQALEALKILLDLPGQLGDELLMIDLSTVTISRIRARRAAACSAGACVRAAAAAREAEAARAAPALELSFTTLATALEEGFELIDVREPHEVAQAAAPAARVRHIPLQQLLRIARGEPQERQPLECSAKYLLLCATGRRSLGAAQELRARGFKSAYSLHGGIAALSARLPA
ncbi:MAG TPA: ThiF family adenylyltransferase [Steroidobacteraceae bacterium]|nr:ThiF family adenylyltransferase [Steroidobacteraceae bacterium]